MGRRAWLGRLGLAVVVAGGGLGLIAAEPLRARQVPELPDDTNNCHPIQPDTQLVATPAHSVAWTRTWLHLQKVEPLEYPNGVKLGDLLKRVREATRAPELGFPRGVSIYVDRPGLADADRTVDSEVTVDLDGVTLHKGLTLALRQIGLLFQIDEDGLIVITSPQTSDQEIPFTPSDVEWVRLDQIHGQLRSLSRQMTDLRREVVALREALRLPAQPSTALPGLAPQPPTTPSAGSPGGGFR